MNLLIISIILSAILLIVVMVPVLLIMRPSKIETISALMAFSLPMIPFLFGTLSGLPNEVIKSEVIEKQEIVRSSDKYFTRNGNDVEWTIKGNDDQTKDYCEKYRNVNFLVEDSARPEMEIINNLHKINFLGLDIKYNEKIYQLKLPDTQ